MRENYRCPHLVEFMERYGQDRATADGALLLIQQFADMSAGLETMVSPIPPGEVMDNAIDDIPFIALKGTYAQVSEDCLEIYHTLDPQDTANIILSAVGGQIRKLRFVNIAAVHLLHTIPWNSKNTLARRLEVIYSDLAITALGVTVAQALWDAISNDLALGLDIRLNEAFGACPLGDSWRPLFDGFYSALFLYLAFSAVYDIEKVHQLAPLVQRFAEGEWIYFQDSTKDRAWLILGGSNGVST